MIGTHPDVHHRIFQRTQSRRHAHVPLTPSEPVESWWKAIAAGVGIVLFIAGLISFMRY